MTGGMESLNPPVGAWVVLAQDGESTDRTTRTATGIRGKYLEMNFFIVDTISCKNQAYISVRATDWIPSMEPSFRIIRSKAALSCTSRSM